MDTQQSVIRRSKTNKMKKFFSLAKLYTVELTAAGFSGCKMLKQVKKDHAHPTPSNR